ncbi:DUF7453 family protein [Verrucomicrobiota bacterium sgz303538]
MRRFPVPPLASLIALLFLALTGAGHAQVYISEFMALNRFTTTVDEEGERTDWIELYNAGATSVSLNGWYLTDNAGDLRKWQFPVSTPAVTLAAGDRILIYASGKNRKVLASRLHTNFALESKGGYLALVRPDGLTVEHAYANYPQQIQDVAYGLPTAPWQTLIAQGSAGKAKVPQSAADMAAGWNSSVSYDDSSWQSGQSGFGYDTTGSYGTLIGTSGDLQASMYNVNSTALVRILFNVANPAAITALRLQMKYDDGFIAYLNGTPIAKINAPDNPAFDSAAVTDRSEGLTQTFEIFSSPDAQKALVAGDNVLAFQLLNNSNGSVQDTDTQNVPNGSRALLLPVLEATFTPEPSYLATATPRTANSAARTNVGPLISKTTDTPPRPLGNASSPPIVITAQVVPSLRPISTVQLRYRIMFGGESSLTMMDDGTGGDAVAGDSIFTAQMPTSSLPAGQMIRWRVVATDTASSSTTDPPYLNPLDNDQYYGTVALETLTANSQAPVMHWFVQNAAASQTEGGTRCSLFFLGRFYDNVFVGLHGQSSSGFAVTKKSHDFNFSKDNRFKWKEGEKTQRAVNLITTWADKSKVRDTLAWESWKEVGHIASHWAQLVRVQQNGAFWGLYDMVENGDEDFLQRAGLDQAGALYKIYNSLESTSGAEKKSREFETSLADLQTLINGLDNALPLTTRRQFAYDNVDVASLVNYLANNVLIINNDFGHKNYYVYRDTNGTGEWSVLPWDQDLSFGHTWTSSQGYFNDDIHTQAGLVIGAASGNRLMNLIMNSSTSTIAPEMAQMFLRRMRTLMDTRIGAPGTTNSPIEQRINQLLDLIDPPGASFRTDADEDLQKWGYWTDGSGSQLSPNNSFDAATHDHGARKQAARIINSNPIPPNPGAVTNAEGLGDTTPAFLVGRRTKLFNGGLTLAGLPIPPSQPAVPTGLSIEQIDFNPASGKADEEFFVIKNSGTTAIDLSGWKITGAVDYTFRGGTVIPAGGGTTQNIGLLHVARNPKAFRSRTTGPKGGQFRLVTGGYDGRLSARGGAIELRNTEGTLVTSNTFAPAPTPAQNSLRVTEVNFAPAAPTATESAALPGVQASDFEFIELVNTGSTPLSLGGTQFDRGITFSFPAGFTLAPGARTVVVSTQAAFTLRYGAGVNIAGQYEGNLSNSGEQIRLLDNVGEEVLRFTYSPTWYPATVGGGYSLVATSSNPAFDSYDASTGWRVSSALGGSPGTAEPPILSSPIAGKFNAPVTVSYVLPEAALAGTLKLIFDDGVTPRVLILASSEGTIGEHSFSLDTANPTASASVVSGEPLPDGTYTVRLSYQDVADNPPTRSADVSGVFIDRAGPVLTLPENQVAEASSAAGAVVAYPQATATDADEVASLTYSQLAATVFPIGVTTVTVTATDTLGHVSTGTFTVTVRDTMSPQITSVPTGRSLTAGPTGTQTLPDLTGEVVATDTVGVASIVQTPEAGTVLSVGTHQVTFVATDAAGNSTSTTAAVDVRDTTSPQITSVPTGRVLAAGPSGTLVLPNLTGEVVATDNVGVASIVQVPAAGAVWSLGTHQLTFVVTDAAGNSSSTTASVEVRFARPSPHAETEAVRMSGSAAPGAGLPGGPPAGTTLGAFGVPALSTFRDVTARVTLQNGRKKLSGIHFEDGAGTARLLAFQGATAPGVSSGATFVSFYDPVISPDGEVAFSAKVKGGGVTAKNDEGVWTTAFTGDLTLALREGQTVSGASGALLDKVMSVSARDGELLALITLRKGAGGVTAANDMALLRRTASGDAVLLREGAPLTLDDRPSTIKTITVLSPALASPGHGRWHADGKVVAKVTLADKREAVVTIAGDGAIESLLVDGDSATSPDDGTKWDSFSLPAIDSHGVNVAIRGTFLKGAGGVTATNDTAIAVSTAGNPFVVVAREGGPAPDTSGTQFATFFDPLVSDTGSVAFLATLKGSGITNSTKTGLWVGLANAPKLIARAGDRAVDADGLPRPAQFWNAFTSYALGEGSEGGPIFLATLKGTGVTPKSNLGLWAVDSTGKLREILRTGDQMSVNGQTKTVAKMTLLNSARGVFGTTRSFNATGSIALLATFTDKSQGLVRLEVP